jgi:hypothetical protein
MHRRRPLGDVGEDLVGDHRPASGHERAIRTTATWRRREQPSTAVVEVFGGNEWCDVVDRCVHGQRIRHYVS